MKQKIVEEGQMGEIPQRKSTIRQSQELERTRIITYFRQKFYHRIVFFYSQSNSEGKIPISAAVALPKYEFSGDIKELDEKIESLMCRGEHMIRNSASTMTTAYVCNVCGKEGSKSHIKSHIEGIHLE